MGKGGFVDSSNNDVTANKIHSALGEVNGLRLAGGVEDKETQKAMILNQFNKHGMIGELNDKGI